MIRVSQVKLNVSRNLAGRGLSQVLREPGMYVAEGCVILPRTPGLAIPLHLVDVCELAEAEAAHDPGPVVQGRGSGRPGKAR